MMIQENLLKLVKALGETFSQIGSGMAAPMPHISPDTRMTKQSN